MWSQTASVEGRESSPWMSKEKQDQVVNWTTSQCPQWKGLPQPDVNGDNDVIYTSISTEFLPLLLTITKVSTQTTVFLLVYCECSKYMYIMLY